MEKCFCVDSMAPNAASQIRDYLLIKLKAPIIEKRPIIFLCIGTDRSTGDSLGPLIGYKLKSFHKNNIYIYGTLESPIHSKNLEDILVKIDKYFNNPYIVAIDSCLGIVQNIGKVFIDETPITPGLALNKDLPPIGNLSIKGIVNISGNLDFIVLQNTRLFTVMSLADCISSGIKSSLNKIFAENNNADDLENYNFLD